MQSYRYVVYVYERLNQTVLCTCSTNPYVILPDRIPLTKDMGALSNYHAFCVINNTKSSYR